VKRFTIRYFLFFYLAAQILEAQTHHWVRTNPGGGGAFNTIEAGPTGIILAGSDLSGAYISFDRGNSWEVIGVNRGMTETHVCGLGFHPADSSVFFIGTENGIFRTGNTGQSFTKVLAGGYITDIKCAPSNPDIVYASYHSAFDTADGKIYKSSDGGFTWQQASNNLPSGIHILKIIPNPADANIVYLLTGSGRFACGPADVYKSTDGGINWTNITSGFPEIMDMALSPQNPSEIYITTMNADCSAPYYWTDLNGSLYKSLDGGNSWILLSNRTGMIFPDPGDSLTLRLIDPRQPYTWNPEAGTFTSVDGGLHFSRTGDVSAWDTFHNGDPYWCYSTSFNGICKTIGRDLSDPARLYWVTSQWVFGSTDNGSVFHNLFTDQISPGFWRSRGIDNVNMTDIAVNEKHPDTIFLAYFDMGIWRSFDGGNSWQSCNDDTYSGEWEGHGGNCATILSDPDRPEVVWASQSENQNGEYPTYLLKNNFAGDKNHWILSNNGLPEEQIMGLSLDRTSDMNNRTLYVTAGKDVYKSTDDGTTWTKVFDCNGCRFTAVDYFNGNTVYAGGENGLWRSLDAGNSWTNIGHPDMQGNGWDFWDYGYEGIFDIKTDPNNPGVIFVCVLGPGKGLYKSTDYGNTWVKLLTDDFMRKVAIAPQNSSLLYATSSSAFQAGGYDIASNGVLFSPDGGQHWTRQNQGMAFPFALAVTVSRHPNPVVFVGSPGTGFQKAEIPPAYVHTEKLQTGSISLFPNPVEKTLRIKFNAQKFPVKTYLLTGQDISGEIPVTEQNSHLITLDFSRLPAGVYIVRAGDIITRVIKK